MKSFGVTWPSVSFAMRERMVGRGRLVPARYRVTETALTPIFSANSAAESFRSSRKSSSFMGPNIPKWH